MTQFIGYEQIPVTTDIQTAADLDIPAAAQGAILQAESAVIRYSMVPEGKTPGPPPNAGRGMLLRNTGLGQYFMIENIRNIKFVAQSGSPKLNIHYIGRNE